MRSKIATSNEYKKGTEQRQVRGGQEWGLRHSNVGPGGEQVRKGEISLKNRIIIKVVQ